MAKDRYKLNNKFGLHVYLIPTSTTNCYILETPDVHSIQTEIDINNGSIESVNPEGGPLLSINQNFVDKIELVEKETGENLKYTQQVGVETAYKITFNSRGIPEEIIGDVF